MKRYLLPVIAIILSSCGPSNKEKLQIATISCNYISETRNMDATLRLKEMNVAREKLGEDPFLGVDDDIKDAVKYGLCKELVLNDPDYDTKLLEARNEELRLLEITLSDLKLKNERENARRDSIAKVESKKREEKERVRAEANRIRSIETKKKIDEQQVKWRLKVAELVKVVPSTLPGELEWNQRSKTFTIKAPCKNLTGLSRIVTVYFKGDLGKVENESTVGFCNNNVIAQFNANLSIEQEKSLVQNQSDLGNIIERITVSVIGVYDVKSINSNDSGSELSEYFPQYYPNLNYSTTLADPFVYEIQF